MSNLTLADFLKTNNPDLSEARIIESMSQANDMMQDAPFVEANGKDFHLTTRRTSIPTGTWKGYNEGVIPSKSETSQFYSPIGMLEDYSEIDANLVEISSSPNLKRDSENRAFAQGLTQTGAETFIYGEGGKKFEGLAMNFDSLTGDNKDQIIDAGGNDNDNTSIWLITWDEETCHFIYPQGGTPGIKMENEGKLTLAENGKRRKIYRTFFKWHLGLAIRDPRYIVRIANIKTTALNKEASGSSADLIDAIMEALNKVHSQNVGKMVFYCNRFARSFIQRQQMNHPNVLVAPDAITGKITTSVGGVPVRLIDQILNTESTIV